MRALEVAKLDELVARVTGIAFCEDQVTFALPDRDAAADFRSKRAGRVDDAGGVQDFSIVERDAAVRGTRHSMAGYEHCAKFLSLCDQVFGRALGIEDGIVGDEQAAGERTAQVRFGLGESPAIKKLAGNAVAAIALEFALD